MPRTKKPTPHQITVNANRYDPPALFLREHMATASSERVVIEVDKNISGDCLIFSIVGKFGEGQYTVRTVDLVKAVAALHESLHAAGVVA